MSDTLYEQITERFFKTRDIYLQNRQYIVSGCNALLIRLTKLLGCSPRMFAIYKIDNDDRYKKGPIFEGKDNLDNENISSYLIQLSAVEFKLIFALHLTNNEEVIIEIILKRESNIFTLALPFTKEEYTFTDYNSDEQMEPVINEFKQFFDNLYNLEKIHDFNPRYMLFYRYYTFD
ncbi:MAG: hypothetical protein H8D45_27305 [Bacteroidetes bacterium]|nr:hypothetical protein [Bacteroidota bacterium]